MAPRQWFVLPAACGLLVLTAASALATEKVKVKGIHLCCASCVKGVEAALKGVEGVAVVCDQETSTVTLTAKSNDILQHALDALGTAGYFGDTRNPRLAIRADTPPPGKVKKATLTGIHNCCGKCCTAIKAVIKTVDGIKADTAKPKSTTIEVTGDFEPSTLLESLNAAGFNATIK